MEVLDVDVLRAECQSGLDLSYNMDLARSSSTWVTIHQYLSETVPSPDSHHAAIFRFAQVSFAHGSDIQDVATSRGIHGDLVRYIPIHAEVSFKALSNLITKNEAVIDEVLPVVLKSSEVKAMAGRLSNFVLLFLRNAMYFSKSERHFERCKSILESGLVLRLLRDNVEEDNADEEDSFRFALSVGIMDVLFNEGFAGDCISLSTTTTTTTTSHKFEGRARSLVRREVYKFLDQYTFQDKEHANVPFVLVTEGCAQVDELATFLDDHNDTRAQFSDETQVRWTSVSLLISALGALLSQESAVPLLQLTAIQRVVEPAIKALGLAHVHFPRSKGGRITDLTGGFELPNFKRDCITIISNLSHGNKSVQDQVRHLGGLPLVLGQCNIDELNPYLREHAMYCIRNLLENNKENQDVVDSIKPVGVEQSSELSDLGYSAELKDGKIGVSRTAKIESINED